MGRRLRDLPRLAAIMGGFLIMAGMLLVGVAALALAGYLDVGLLLEHRYLLIFALVLMAVGLLDIVLAVIIARW